MLNFKLKFDCIIEILKVSLAKYMQRYVGAGFVTNELI